MTPTANTRLPVPDNSHRELIARVRVRALFGWLPTQEALTVFSLNASESSEAIRTAEHAAMSLAVQNRPEYIPESPIIVNHRGWNISAARRRPELQVDFSGHTMELCVVDLRKILAFQKNVRLPGVEGQIAISPENKAEILSICLPESQTDDELVWSLDGDGKGVTLSSFNPNFKVYGAHMGTVSIPSSPDLPAVQRSAISISYGIPISYLHVAEYDGRYFLRDGYHRAVGLLKAGVNEVPCVLIRAANIQQVFSAAGNFLSPEVIMGTHPPLLADFLDNGVSGEGEINEVRKVIRVRGDEFVVLS